MATPSLSKDPAVDREMYAGEMPMSAAASSAVSALRVTSLVSQKMATHENAAKTGATITHAWRTLRSIGVKKLTAHWIPAAASIRPG